MNCSEITRLLLKRLQQGLFFSGKMLLDYKIWYNKIVLIYIRVSDRNGIVVGDDLCIQY